MKKLEKTYPKTEERKPFKTTIETAIDSSVINSGSATKNSIETITEAVSDDLSENYLRNRIETAIEEYKVRYDTDIYSLTQRQWNHVLRYIYNSAIKPLKIDYRDVYTIDILSDIFLSITEEYNKSSSVYGFCILINMNYGSLINNKYNKYTLSDIYIDITNNIIVNSNLIDIHKARFKDCTIVKVSNDIYRDIIKKIDNDREHSLTDKAENGSVMSLALGKIEFQWIESAKEKIQVEMLENYRLPSDLLNKYSDN